MSVFIPDMERVPPNNIEAERAVLGAVLLNNDVLMHVSDILTPSSFYRTGHKVVYGALLALDLKRKPIDTITVVGELRARGELDDAGGAAYISSLTNEVPSTSHAVHYAEIIKDHELQRKMIWAANEISAEGYTAPDVKEFIEKAEQSVMAVALDTTTAGPVRLADSLGAVFNNIEEVCKKKDEITGIPSGFYDLDALTAGWHPADLIIVAGRPGMGKTALALSLAKHAAQAVEANVAFFSLEMSTAQLVLRLLCMEGQVNQQRVRKGQLKEADWPILTRAAGILSELNLFIDDTPAITTMDLRSRARRLHAKNNLGMIVVDYLQLMRASGKRDNREQEISEISRSLKALAKELDVPVIALSQLNRSLEARADKRPMISDLRESGAIEQDADVILFPFREEIYKKDDEDLKGVAELILGKQRQGPTGTAPAVFESGTLTFRNSNRTYS